MDRNDMTQQPDAQRVIDKIQAAAATTADVRQIVDRASHSLDEFKARTNALSVLMEPHTLRQNLIVVRAELDRAIQLIETAKWPTDRDYNKT
jgi:hypothetical protein